MSLQYPVYLPLNRVNTSMRSCYLAVSLAALLIAAAACSDDRPSASPREVPTATAIVTPNRKVLHNEAQRASKGWPPVLFKTPISGRFDSTGQCVWNASGWTNPHPKLSFTLGEYDTTT